jgi:hypothetical protein
MPTPPPDRSPRTRKPIDPELAAMNRVAAVLEDLSPPARKRVLDWVFARYDSADGPAPAGEE